MLKSLLHTILNLVNPFFRNRTASRNVFTLSPLFDYTVFYFFLTHNSFIYEK